MGLRLGEEEERGSDCCSEGEWTRDHYTCNAMVVCAKLDAVLIEVNILDVHLGVLLRQSLIKPSFDVLDS